MSPRDADTLHAYHERAAIKEHDARIPRPEAEAQAAAEFRGREAAVVEMHRQGRALCCQPR